MNQLTQFIICRHGNTFNKNHKVTYIGSKTDVTLTQQGKMQIKKIANLISSNYFFPKIFFSSSLKRQIQSLKIIMNFFNSSPSSKIEKTLKELDYGQWEGKTTTEIKNKWPQEYAAWENEGIWPAGVFGESYEERMTGLREWLFGCAKKYAGESVLAVTSGGVLKLILSMTEGYQDLVKKKCLRDYKVGTGCFCELEVEGDVVRIVRWNVSPGDV